MLDKVIDTGYDTEKALQCIFESRDLSWDPANVNEDDDNFLTFEKMITPDGEL